MYEPVSLAPQAMTWLTVPIPQQPADHLRPPARHTRRKESPRALKAFLREAFTRVMEDLEPVDSAYGSYFARDYVQHADGRTLDFDRFVAHLKARKQDLRSLTVRFEQMIVEDDRIATIHVARAIHKDGHPVEARVHAVFQVRGGRIVQCEELTRQLQGEPAEVSPGSASGGAAPALSSR